MKAKTKAKTDAQLLADGRAAYRHRHWQDSLDAHLQLIANGAHASHGFYGIALIRLVHKDYANARIQLLNCVQLQPNHANAHYYLGEIARIRGEHGVAIARYRRALAANPAHRSAKQRLVLFQRNRPPVKNRNHFPPAITKKPSSSTTKPPLMKKREFQNMATGQGLAPNRSEILLGRVRALNFGGRERIAPFVWKLIARFIAAFIAVWVAIIVFNPFVRAIERRPDFLSFIVVVGIIVGGLLFWLRIRETIANKNTIIVVGNLVAAVATFVLAGILTGVLTGGAQIPPTPFYLQSIILAALLSVPLIVAIRTTVCTVNVGWVRVVAGIFNRAPIAIPFYQIQDVAVRQSGLDRFFDSADLSFKFSNDAGQVTNVDVLGVGKYSELQTLARQINEIAAELRSGLWRAGTNYFSGPASSVLPMLNSVAAQGSRNSRRAQSTKDHWQKGRRS
jgi:tetratricopeptide (TPR) repeat protein